MKGNNSNSNIPNDNRSSRNNQRPPFKSKSEGKLNEINVESDHSKKTFDCFVVTGKINSRDAKLLIETGANNNHIKPSFLKKIDMKSEESGKMIKICLGLKGQKIIVPEKTIELELSINDQCKSNVKFYELEINQ